MGGRAQQQERRARRAKVHAQLAADPWAPVSADDLRLARRPYLVVWARARGVRGASTMTKIQLERAGAAASAAAAAAGGRRPCATGPPYPGWTPVLELFDSTTDPNVYCVADDVIDRLYAAAAADIYVTPDKVNRAVIFCDRETEVDRVWTELTDAAKAGPNAVCVRHDKPYTPEDFSRGSIIVMA
jgi:hypothetical protein